MGSMPKTNIESVTIGNEVQQLPSDFVKGSKITSITIPNSVITIGSSAFSGCTSLTDVTIPNSVITIGSSAFSGCSGIKDLTWDTNCSSMGSMPKTNIENVIIGNQVESLPDFFVAGSKITSITIPNSVITIGSSAFSGCTSLSDVTIPNSVTSIGGSAFANCSGLTSIDFPNNITSIGNSTFSGCSSLTSIEIPHSVTSIGSSTFAGCTGLTNVTIPNSVTSIGGSAFANCSGLTSIDLPNNITSIGNSTFSGCSSLTSIEIPNSVTSIGSSTFAGCTGLTNVIIPNSVTSIGNNAFEGCSGLTSIDLPNNITNIGEAAFKGCSSLTSFVFPKSLTSLGGFGVFEDCHNLTQIIYPDSINCRGLLISMFNLGCFADIYSYLTDPSKLDIEEDLENINLALLVMGYWDQNFRPTLHVPAGLLDAYQSQSWSPMFGNIVEMEPEVILASSIELNVTTAGLNEGATLQLTATVLPDDAADKSVTWTSSDESVATVDDNGLVTMQGDGTATITAMTTDGSDLSTTCSVTLLPVGIKGDINGDEKISIGDVTTLITYLLTGSW